MLHAAAWHARYEVIAFLLSHKFDANLRNKKQNTALHLLMERTNEPRALDCIRLLLEHGADPTLANESGITALQIGLQQQPPVDLAADPQFQLLVEKFTNNSTSSSDSSAAAETDLVEQAEQCFRKLRLSFLAAVEVKSESSMIETLQSALPFVRAGHLSLDRPIKVSSGSTFLHTCAWFLKTQLAQWLIDHGVRFLLSNLFLSLCVSSHLSLLSSGGCQRPKSEGQLSASPRS